MLYDGGGDEEKLEPTLHKDIKFSQVRDLLLFMLTYMYTD